MSEVLTSATTRSLWSAFEALMGHMMNNESDQQRLDAISTCWSRVFDAHCDNSDKASLARSELLQRYRNVVYLYLLAMVRDIDTAQELSQQFAVKVLEGTLHRATPDRGRFRDYVKTVIINQVRQFRKDQARSPQPLPEYIVNSDGLESDEEPEFNRQWRSEVLNLTWESLREQRRNYYELLRLRIDNPELTSRQLADRRSIDSGKTVSAATIRKTLERAHSKFASLLVQEVAGSLTAVEPEQLKSELNELDLLKYCRSELKKWIAKHH